MEGAQELQVNAIGSRAKELRGNHFNTRHAGWIVIARYSSPAQVPAASRKPPPGFTKKNLVYLARCLKK